MFNFLVLIYVYTCETIDTIKTMNKPIAPKSFIIIIPIVIPPIHPSQSIPKQPLLPVTKYEIHSSYSMYQQFIFFPHLMLSSIPLLVYPFTS